MLYSKSNLIKTQARKFYENQTKIVNDLNTI